MYLGASHRQVPRREPDLLAHLVLWNGSLVPISQAFVTSSRPPQCCSGLSPDSTGSAKMSLYRGNSCVGLLAGEQWRLETIYHHEGRHTCDRADQRVVGILHPWQMGGPGGKEMENHTTQGGFQVLICLFHLAISLGVITRRKAGSGSQGLTERFPHLGMS